MRKFRKRDIGVRDVDVGWKGESLTDWVCRIGDVVAGVL